MSLTEVQAQPETPEPQSPESTQAKRRRLPKKLLVGAIALGVCIGTAGGYVASQPSSTDPVERGRIADSARLQAQADAYLAQRQRYGGMSADAAAHWSQSDSSTDSRYSGMSADAAEQWSQAAEAERYVEMQQDRAAASSSDEFVPGSRQMPTR
jgi:hypothetical protein